MDGNTQKVSVLMSLYVKENPAFLQQALTSIFGQTVKPDEVVLVEDGPITPELEQVVEDFHGEHPEMKLVKLEKNQGLGKALNRGLRECSYELVARMDTDDIAYPDRLERQLKVFALHPEIDVCSAWMDEFSTDAGKIDSIKKVPETHEEIYEFGKSRNPINHPVVMFKRDAVLNNGSYRHFPMFEDYYLWVRMLTNDCMFYNIQASLMNFRADRSMIRRRGGIMYAWTEIRLEMLFYGMWYISFSQMIKNMCIRGCARLMPNWMRKILYKTKLRSR